MEEKNAQRDTENAKLNYFDCHIVNFNLISFLNPNFFSKMTAMPLPMLESRLMQ